MIALRHFQVVPATAPSVVGIDTEHCLFAATAGLQPFQVLDAIGIRMGVAPTWDDARLAVRVTARRLRRAA
jgi:hypothetical protein